MKTFSLLCLLTGIFGWSSHSWAIGGYIGEFITTDSVDLEYVGVNCYGNTATADTIRWYVYKDTTTGATIKVDSGKVATGTLPSRLLRGEFTFVKQYSLRIPATKSQLTGKYSVWMIVRTDTCFTPFVYIYDVVDTLIRNLVKVNSTNIKAVKAKTDSSSYTAGGYIKSDIQILQKWLGAGDAWRQHLFPIGSANKDSVVIFDGATKVSTIYFYHTGAVMDSIKQEIW